MANDKDIQLAIVFADIVGSTRYYEELGDTRAREIIGITLELMRLATEQHGGTVVKTMGDEVMSTFPSADAAVDAASQMQRQISVSPFLQTKTWQVAVRVGCHLGLVAMQHRDIFGAAVHTANRVTSQAKGGQILTTVAVVEQLSSAWQSAIRQIDIATLKGHTDETALYEVHWQTDDITGMLPSISMASLLPKRGLQLTVRGGGQTFDLGDRDPSLTIGRADNNQLIIKGDLVSRLHARIEISRTRFILVDMSTNGTFLRSTQGPEQFVRRDAVTLTGEGLIGLGEPPDAGSPLVIRYALLSA
jgi:class 3 adenylate cyclase